MGKARRPIQIVILLLIVVLGGYAIGTAVSGGEADKPKQGVNRRLLSCSVWMDRYIRWMITKAKRSS